MEIITHIIAFLIGGTLVAFILMLFTRNKNSGDSTEHTIEKNAENSNSAQKFNESEKDEAKAITVEKLSKKVKRRITKGLFTDSAKNADKQNQITDENNMQKINNYSLAATQEFDQAELLKLAKREATE